MFDLNGYFKTTHNSLALHNSHLLLFMGLWGPGFHSPGWAQARPWEQLAGLMGRLV